jgi:hypothetical protein
MIIGTLDKGIFYFRENCKSMNMGEFFQLVHFYTVTQILSGSGIQGLLR